MPICRDIPLELPMFCLLACLDPRDDFTTCPKRNVGDRQDRVGLAAIGIGSDISGMESTSDSSDRF